MGELKEFLKFCIEFLKIYLTGALTLFIVLGLTLSVSIIMHEDYCKDKPSYFMDDTCFSPTLRCQTECSHYNKNFTGKISGCSCDCGDGAVSMCSGFYYSYNKSENKPITHEEALKMLNITEDDIIYDYGD